MFFLKLEHSEGEFALGLARRTFNEDKDIPEKEYEVQWFVRKSRNASWGVQPAFKLALRTDGRRRSVPHCDVVPLDTFAHIPVEVTTSSSRRRDAPVLTKNCMALLRSLVGSEQELSGADSSAEEEETKRVVSAAQRVRHRPRLVTDSSDEEVTGQADTTAHPEAEVESDDEPGECRKRRRSCHS